MAYILGRQLIDALIEAGIANEATRRVVIDCPISDVVRVYVEQVGDKRLLSIVPPLAGNGVQIHRELIDPVPTLESDDLDKQ